MGLAMPVPHLGSKQPPQPFGVRSENQRSLRASRPSFWSSLVLMSAARRCLLEQLALRAGGDSGSSVDASFRFLGLLLTGKAMPGVVLAGD